jgi:Anti-sigma factor NepR
MKDMTRGAFGPHPADTRESLSIAQNLARLYADVLEEPLPADLARLIGRLERRMSDQFKNERGG